MACVSESDPIIASAAALARRAIDGESARPEVAAFFDEATHTVSYVIHDPGTRRAAILDSVLDYDAASGRTATASAERIVSHVSEHRLTVDWILETHAHADHLSAAPLLQEKLGGRLGIGREIVRVQEAFGKYFNAGTPFKREAADFDQLFADGERFAIGALEAMVLHVPGHTPADVAYVVGDCAFVGDTLFMPDYGTARTDFPGGCARQLYRSIRRLLSLPAETRLFLCHDYKAPGREDYRWETTVAEQRSGNVHIRDGVEEEEFVAMRQGRDRTLAMPDLLMPAVQVNIRGGRLPEPDANGIRYIRIPLNTL